MVDYFYTTKRKKNVYMGHGLIKIIMCDENVDFNHFFFFFSENICGHPPVPVNAKLVREGTKATYVCDDGYRLFG